MNRIIIIVTDFNWFGFQNVILLGSIEKVKDALDYFIHLCESFYGDAFWVEKHCKVLLNKHIQDVSDVKNKINCLNNKKQILFFITKDNKISLGITNRENKYPALYWFEYQNFSFCKHKVVDKDIICDCRDKLRDKLISNNTILDIALPSIIDFISELNLPIEPLWRLAAAVVKKRGIPVDKTNATDYAIQAVNEYYLYDLQI